MRRWNGWGDENTQYNLPPGTANFLEQVTGKGTPAQDITIADALRAIHLSDLHGISDSDQIRLSISLDPFDRLLHTRGQSLPDWIALRSGRLSCFPDAVAYPSSTEQVCELIDFVRKNEISLIPYGGGTSVVGHINPLPEYKPTITVNLHQLSSLVNLDEDSKLATFGAGISGPKLEAALNRYGYTLGHYPQSHELSTLGGWIATRSNGQQSYHYGRIEDLFVGGVLETPSGKYSIPNLPASAAGPDLRHLVLGSEGRIGIITQATVRIQTMPEFEAFYGAFFHNWEAGVMAMRIISQSGVPASMLRLSDPEETETTLLLSGKANLIKWAQRGLSLLHYGGGKSLLIYGITGNRAQAQLARRQIDRIIRSQQGLPTGRFIGNAWQKSRFRTPYMRNSLWETGYALDTLETAITWSKVNTLQQAIKEVLRQTAERENYRVFVLSHLSHIYPDGASIYTTYLYPRTADPEQILERWHHLKHAASKTICSHGGTISHQHGVGHDHLPYLQREKDPLGIAAIKSACQVFDPHGIFNPGKLFD
jgi:alkyldihydroxyacetonephosphate synthase